MELARTSKAFFSLMLEMLYHISVGIEKNKKHGKIVNYHNEFNNDILIYAVNWRSVSTRHLNV